jgi:hypothetical protein
MNANLIKHLDAHRHSVFRETFSTTKHYPYTPPELDLMTDKASAFLVQQFRSIFAEHKRSVIDTPPPTKAPRPRKKAKSEGANIKFLTISDLDRTALPAGYHTTYPPEPNGCDHCHAEFARDQDGTVLICGHGYHWHCYSQMQYKCGHCLEYYKKGVWTNVDTFLKRLSAGQDNLTQEEMEDDEQDDMTEDDPDGEGQEGVKMNEREKVALDLQNSILEIQNW